MNWVSATLAAFHSFAGLFSIGWAVASAIATAAMAIATFLTLSNYRVEQRLRRVPSFKVKVWPTTSSLGDFKRYGVGIEVSNVGFGPALNVKVALMEWKQIRGEACCACVLGVGESVTRGFDLGIPHPDDAAFHNEFLVARVEASSIDGLTVTHPFQMAMGVTRAEGLRIIQLVSDSIVFGR